MCYEIDNTKKSLKFESDKHNLFCIENPSIHDYLLICEMISIQINIQKIEKMIIKLN